RQMPSSLCLLARKTRQHEAVARVVAGAASTPHFAKGKDLQSSWTDRMHQSNVHNQLFKLIVDIRDGLRGVNQPEAFWKLCRTAQVFLTSGFKEFGFFLFELIQLTCRVQAGTG